MAFCSLMLGRQEDTRSQVLAAAVDLHDRGDVGPVKKARTSPAGTPDEGQQEQRGAALTSSLVDTTVDQTVDQLEQLEPVDLAENQRIEVKWQLIRENSEEAKVIAFDLVGLHYHLPLEHHMCLHEMQCSTGSYVRREWFHQIF